MEIGATSISQKVHVHDPALPRSARTDTKSIIVVTNRNRVRFEKLRVDNQHDYEMKIDAVEMLPHTWQHAGLPPDGTFAPKHIRDTDDSLWPLTDYDGFMILVTTACNLVMRDVALSYYDRKKFKEDDVKVNPTPAKPLPPGKAMMGSMTSTTTTEMYDELDEKRMTYVLDMLVRLFYRGDGEVGERDGREQELRKAIILYMGGTGGANQFINFTSLLMSLELAVGFAESENITSNDASHKEVKLLIDIIRWRGIDTAGSKSDLVKSCRRILGDMMAGRVCECIKLNNRLKHYKRSTEDAKYFDNNVDKINEVIRGLRIDAAYVILLGLIRLYETESPPMRTAETHRTSQLILNMIEDCVDRHGAARVDGGVEAKIQRLMDFIENDDIKSEKITYDLTRPVLRLLMILVKAARMLGESDGLTDVRSLMREHEDVIPDDLKPPKYKFDIEHDEEALHDWLVRIAHSAVVWMDSQFHITSVISYIAKFGRTSGIKCDKAIF